VAVVRKDISRICNDVAVMHALRGEMSNMHAEVSSLRADVLSSSQRTHHAFSDSKAADASPARCLAQAIVANIPLCTEFLRVLQADLLSAQHSAVAEARLGSSVHATITDVFAAAAQEHQKLAVLVLAVVGASSLDLCTGFATASVFAFFRMLSHQKSTTSSLMMSSHADSVVLIDLLGRRKFLDPTMCASPAVGFQAHFAESRSLT
jgi:hypothetical protein